MWVVQRRPGFGKIRDMKAKFLLTALVLLGGGAFAAEPKSVTIAQLNALESESVAATGPVVVNGVVTFVSGIDAGRFVIADAETPRRPGLTVFSPTGVAAPQFGDYVQVEGAPVWRDGAAVVAATRVEFIRAMTLAPAAGAKQYDFRQGMLAGRRVSLRGTVREVRVEDSPAGSVSLVALYIDKYTAHLRVAGALDADRYVGEEVRAEGVAISRYGKDGDFLDAELEVADEDHLERLRTAQVPRILIIAAVLFGLALLFFAGMFFTLWIRAARERRREEVIAEERRRMAADLHDTIEQHLAGANLIAAGVLGLEDVPADVVEAMKSLTGLLANAKAEVRNAVLNLRGAGCGDKPLAEAIGDMARSLEKTGVKVRKCLRGLPEKLAEGVYQDIILILREATTNAVKHGQARQIVFTGDPVAPAGYVLKVLNDGAPFELSNALGPETGHYGLSGMRERALRNHLAIDWGRTGKWTYMELRSES